MTIVSFILFLAFAGALTWFIVRKQDVGSNTGFFLAGRSLTYPLIAASLLLTNLSTEQMVGLNGSAFRKSAIRGGHPVSSGVRLLHASDINLTGKPLFSRLF